MLGSHDGFVRGGQDRRGRRSVRRSQMMIDGVDVSDTTRDFKANECTILGWNGGQGYL